MIRIATWNVNSINQRLNHLLAWLNDDCIDIALLQEIKCIDENFPYSALQDIGYQSYVNPQKSRNGVAIITRSQFSTKITKINLFSDSSIVDARYIECLINTNTSKVRVASVYVPNGQSIDSDAFKYKLRFFDKLYEHMSNLIANDEITIIGGDYNVAPDKIDVYDADILNGKLCFNINERMKFRSLINLGFYDAFRVINPNSQIFSWWDYRAGAWHKNRGLRIDHLLLSPQAIDKLQACVINKKLRGLPTPSDHTPVVCDIDLD